jgi:hypothetical protein
MPHQDKLLQVFVTTKISIFGVKLGMQQDVQLVSLTLTLPPQMLLPTCAHVLQLEKKI